MADASWTTTGKTCPAEIGHVCQISECWAKGEKPCIRWIAGERPKPVYALTMSATTVAPPLPVETGTACIERVADHGLAFFTMNGKPYGFTFDKIVGYGGQYPKEIGLKKGAQVEAQVRADGTVASVKLRSFPAQGQRND